MPPLFGAVRRRGNESTLNRLNVFQTFSPIKPAGGTEGAVRQEVWAHISRHVGGGNGRGKEESHWIGIGVFPTKGHCVQFQSKAVPITPVVEQRIGTRLDYTAKPACADAEAPGRGYGWAAPLWDTPAKGMRSTSSSSVPLPLTRGGDHQQPQKVCPHRWIDGARTLVSRESMRKPTGVAWA
jgi:hypothetical protein